MNLLSTIALTLLVLIIATLPFSFPDDGTKLERVRRTLWVVLQCVLLWLVWSL